MAIPTSFTDKRLVKSVTNSALLILALAAIAAGIVISQRHFETRILGTTTQPLPQNSK